MMKNDTIEQDGKKDYPKENATAKKVHEHSLACKPTPPMGTRTLPTTGINHAGLK